MPEIFKVESSNSASDHSRYPQKLDRTNRKTNREHLTWKTCSSDRNDGNENRHCMLTMQDTCWIQLLLLATLSTVDRPLRFHNTETPGCTNLQFCFNDHECMRKSKMRKTNVHAQTNPTDHQTELQVEHFKCTPEPKSIFAADRTRVRAPQDALVSEKRH